MPIYDFRCKKCGQKFTVMTGMNERDKVTCPECKAGDVEQLISGCSVRTGGSGTDGGFGCPRFGGG